MLVCSSAKNSSLRGSSLAFVTAFTAISVVRKPERSAHWHTVASEHLTVDPRVLRFRPNPISYLKEAFFDDDKYRRGVESLYL